MVIPAHNEEFELPGTLERFAEARREFKNDHVEIIVVDNASTDRTAEVARYWNARVVSETIRQIARVRNTGARAATGEILITCDADSVPHPRIFYAIDDAMRRNVFAGGVTILGRDMRLVYWPAFVALNATIVLGRYPAGLFFIRRTDFLAMGGFNEEYFALEDVEFSKRLKQEARSRKSKVAILARTPIYTSTRKFRLCKSGDLLRVGLRAVAMPKRSLRDKEAWDKVYYRDGLREITRPDRQ